MAKILISLKHFYLCYYYVILLILSDLKKAMSHLICISLTWHLHKTLSDLQLRRLWRLAVRWSIACQYWILNFSYLKQIEINSFNTWPLIIGINKKNQKVCFLFFTSSFTKLLLLIIQFLMSLSHLDGWATYITGLRQHGWITNTFRTYPGQNEFMTYVIT